VAKVITLTTLSFLISCKLSFPIVGLKMNSLPSLALKYLNKIVVLCILGIHRAHVPIPRRNCPIYHQFYFCWSMNVQKMMIPATS
jgi:hypothetical protein